MSGGSVRAVVASTRDARAEEELRAAASRLRAWRADPVLMVREEFGAEPDPWQAAALRLFPVSPRLALKACVGPGKSTLLAWMVWNFMGTRPAPKGGATSITQANLYGNLWAELAKWQGRSGYFSSQFVWTQTKIFARENSNWKFEARTWDRSADTETQGQTLGGLHADYVLFVADEAGGYPSSVMASAEGVLANVGADVPDAAVEAHIVIAGNPTHTAGPLWDACVKDRKMWAVIEVSGDPDDPNRAPRVSAEWARGMIRKWGRDSAVVRARVLGAFPRQATDALIGLDQFEDAFGRKAAPDGTPLRGGRKTIGVDVARFGSNMTVLAKRDGDFLVGLVSWGGKDTQHTAKQVNLHAVGFGAEEVRVDDVGVGGGVTDRLNEMRRDPKDSFRAKVVPVNAGASPTVKGPGNDPAYKNLKAQLNLAMQERWFGPGRISIAAELRDTSLASEGSDVRYGFGAGGKVLEIEDKDDFAKRHAGESPDHWDAVVLAFAEDLGPPEGEAVVGRAEPTHAFRRTDPILGAKF